MSHLEKKELEDVTLYSGEISDNTTKLCPSKNAREIKYFRRINPTITKSFKTHLTSEVEKVKLNGSDATKSIRWKEKIAEYIKDPNKSNAVGKAMTDAINKIFDGIVFRRSEFPLNGFMTEDSRISFWNGKAEAVGLYQDKYVIAGWKVVDDFEQFWEKACGDYLHQFLAYAQLLKLHLDLDELPQILLVPIISKDGNHKIHPGMFSDFPKECKEAVKQYEWSKEMPHQLNISEEQFRRMAEMAIAKGDEKEQKVLEEIMKQFKFSE